MRICDLRNVALAYLQMGAGNVQANDSSRMEIQSHLLICGIEQITRLVNRGRGIANAVIPIVFGRTQISRVVLGLS
jgi:hypothetical protein